MKIILLPVYSDDEHYDADCALAVLSLDQPLARRILARRKQLLEGQQTELELHKMHYWGSSGIQYFEWSDGVSAVLSLHTDSNRSLGLTILEAHPLPDEKEMRMECLEMCIHKNGVIWTASPKHSDIEISTHMTPYNLVEECL